MDLSATHSNFVTFAARWAETVQPPRWYTPPASTYALLPDGGAGIDPDRSRILHAVFRNYPGISPHRAPRYNQDYLFVVTRKIDAMVEESLIWGIWDYLARECGFVSLEVYLMLHAGYGVSASLPTALRRHRTDQDHWFTEYELTPAWQGRIQRQAERVGDRLPALEANCNQMMALATYEVQYPGWSDFLLAEDLAPTSSGWNPYGHRFHPSPARQPLLLERLRQTLYDPFPGWPLDRSLPPEESVPLLKDMLEPYRLADSVLADGGRDPIHCGHSAGRVAHLMAAKGFPAHTIVTSRSRSEDTGTAQRVSQEGEALARLLDCTPAWAVIFLGMVVSDDQELWPSREAREEHWRRANADPVSSRRLTHLQQIYEGWPSEKRLWWGNHLRTSPHEVAVACLGGVWHLIDTNAYQFGPAYDRLIVTPLAQAAEEGYLLDLDITQPFDDASFRRPFDLAIHPFFGRVAADNRALAQYLTIRDNR